MSIDLQTLVQGDTSYIQKHNGNYTTIAAAIAALQSGQATAATASLSGGKYLLAEFGSVAAVIGADSYVCSGAGASLTVQPGFCWRPSLSLVLQLIAITAIDFTGQSSGTYYITPDNTGTPMRTTNSAEALYSVVWTGTSFGTITRLAAVVWGAADDILAQTSTALGATYLKLDDRLEAGEAKAVLGAQAGIYQTGRLEKNVGGGVDVTLTAVEANNFVLHLTGALTNNINVNVPLSGGPRGWIVINDTTGPFTLTLKGSSGAGLKLAQNVRTWLMHDGTNLLAVATGPYRPAVAALAYASSLAVDFSYADFAKVTLTGNATITLAGAVDKQKCVLELQQDGTGGRTVTWGSEVRYGSDLTLLTLSTTAGKTDKIGFIYDATAGKYDAVAMMHGF